MTEPRRQRARAPGRERVLVFVPTYNDAEHLVQIAEDVAANLAHATVLVIDDGSRPRIDPSALPAGTLHVRLAENFGLGVCTHIAFDHALGHDYAAVVRIDADGQHPVAEIPRLLAGLEEGADIVAGSRLNPDAGSGPRKILARWLKRYFVFVSWLMTRGRGPSDVNTGLFAANRKAIGVLNRFPLHRFPEPHMFMLACRNGLKTAEVFVEQAPRLYGASSVTVWQALRILYRFNVFVAGELLRGRRP